MLPFLRKILLRFLSLLIPPRATEEMVQKLSIGELRSLTRSEGVRFEGLLPYHEPRVKALVWELKFHRNPYALALAGAILAERAAEISAEALSSVALVPVPMHTQRLHERGFNHAEDLCREISARVERCTVLPLLQKIRETPRQAELSAAARKVNLREMFTVVGGGVSSPHTCLVIDDVTTTGATFSEAERALRDAGVRDIHFLALAYS
jgi:predicted amidophosphoribosyltransferase